MRVYVFYVGIYVLIPTQTIFRTCLADKLEEQMHMIWLAKCGKAMLKSVKTKKNIYEHTYNLA